MSGVNKAILVGNVGKDPIIKELNSGDKVANFPIATTETYKNKDGQKVDNTEWHNITCWERIAEVAGEYLKKGDKVYIEGKIKTRSYEKDGEKKYITEIHADNMTMLGGKPKDSGGQQYPEPKEQETPSDDLPF